LFIRIHSHYRTRSLPFSRLDGADDEEDLDITLQAPRVLSSSLQRTASVHGRRRGVSFANVPQVFGEAGVSDGTALLSRARSATASGIATPPANLRNAIFSLGYISRSLAWVMLPKRLRAPPSRI